MLFHITFWTESPIYNEYTVATTYMTIFFAWVDFITCHKLERDFWKIMKNERGELVEEKVPEGTLEKLEWSFLFWLAIGIIQPSVIFSVERPTTNQPQENRLEYPDLFYLPSSTIQLPAQPIPQKRRPQSHKEAPRPRPRHAHSPPPSPP